MLEPATGRKPVSEGQDRVVREAWVALSELTDMRDSWRSVCVTPLALVAIIARFYYPPRQHRKRSLRQCNGACPGGADQITKLVNITQRVQ